MAKGTNKKRMGDVIPGKGIYKRGGIGEGWKREPSNYDRIVAALDERPVKRKGRKK